MLTIQEEAGSDNTYRIGYSDGTKADEYTNQAVKFGNLEPATIPYFFIINSVEDSRLFIDSQEEFGGYIKIHGISQKLKKMTPGYQIDNSIANYLTANVGQTVPIYYSPNTPPPGWVDYVSLENRDDTYRLEISFDNPCQYIRFINVTPDTETGSYFNYSCERVGEKQYKVVFDAYGALVGYDCNMMLLGFSNSESDQQNIMSSFTSLVSDNNSQGECQSLLMVITPPTAMPYHYEQIIDVPVELDMTMYKDFVNTAKIVTAMDGLMVFPEI